MQWINIIHWPYWIADDFGTRKIRLAEPRDHAPPNLDVSRPEKAAYFENIHLKIPRTNRDKEHGIFYIRHAIFSAVLQRDRNASHRLFIKAEVHMGK